MFRSFTMKFREDEKKKRWSPLRWTPRPPQSRPAMEDTYVSSHRSRRAVGQSSIANINSTSLEEWSQAVVAWSIMLRTRRFDSSSRVEGLSVSEGNRDVRLTITKILFEYCRAPPPRERCIYIWRERESELQKKRKRRRKKSKKRNPKKEWRDCLCLCDMYVCMYVWCVCERDRSVCM